MSEHTSVNLDGPIRPERRSPRRSRVALIVGALVVVLIGALTLHARRPAQAIAAMPPTPVLTVTSATPHQVQWPITVRASGSVAAWQEASIGTQIGGYEIVDVRVNVGDQVKKGQVLARLNTALLRADEAQLKASDDQAQANRQRILSLKSSGAVSDQDVLQYVTQAETADALLASKRLQLQYTDVIAPDDGSISSRTATLGAVVPVGQELFRLIRGNRLEWRGELTASQIAQIQPRQLIALTLPDGSLVTAKVRQLAPSLDAQSRLGIVYADIEPGNRARAGMYADGAVEVGQRTAIVVPAECVSIRDGHNFVLKLDAQGANAKVFIRPVETGRRLGDEVEIVSGVQTSDRLAAKGAGFLNDGDIARVNDAPSASNPAHTS